MYKIKLFLLIIALVAATTFSQNNGLDKGDALPNPVISVFNSYGEQGSSIHLYDYKNGSPTMIVLMPDITARNPAAKVISTGIDTYFSEGLSFRPFEEYRYDNPDLKVLVVAANNADVIREYLLKYNLGFDVVADEKSDIANFFGINKWNGPADASQIYIADKDNKIIYSRTDYKGEGEKLKDIQANLFAMFDLKETLYGDNTFPMLIQGDEARDFDFSYISSSMTAKMDYTMSDSRLADYLGKKNVLLAFYPAPYSISCGVEVNRFDTYAEEMLIDKMRNSGGSDVELLMVSVSNYQILSKWKNDMGLDNVKLVVDATGEISMKYNSYNSYGWNKRTVFLINKEGKVQYIDWDYNVDNEEDFGVLKEQITASK